MNVAFLMLVMFSEGALKILRVIQEPGMLCGVYLPSGVSP
jgi:hypothetical protein